jgi:hypothetical protein
MRALVVLLLAVLGFVAGAGAAAPRAGAATEVLLAAGAPRAGAAAEVLLAAGAPRAGAAAEVLLAAGDIASCSSSGDEATADLLDTLSGTVATLGDNVYDNGTATEFTNCYDPTWGRHMARTKPSAGNHDYNTPGATGYYGYFGAAAGDPAKGYYSYDLGDWHIIVINSNCGAVGGCGAGSAQEQWLRGDLLANVADCTLAYWHHPRFSSGSSHGDNASMQAVWQALYDYGADVVLGGHEHNYERFAPQTPAGAADATNGIREFVVGTGGRSHYGFGAAKPNSEVRDSTSFGVLQLTLNATSYDWEFKPAAGYGFTDSGSGSCHAGAPNDPDYDGVVTASDNCPDDPNPLQENSDSVIGNGRFGGVGSVDDTAAGGDKPGDACDFDDDNDGFIDSHIAEVDPGGDVTYDDDNDGLPACLNSNLDADCDDAGEVKCLKHGYGEAYDTDGSDDGASWDVDCNGIRDGLTAGFCAGLSATADADGDRVPERAEVCKWGTSDGDTDSDGDGLTDCLEIIDVNGDNAKTFLGDLVPYAKAVQLPGASFGKDGDFDYNGDNALGFLQDLLPVAKLVQLGVASGGCDVAPGSPNP